MGLAFWHIARQHDLSVYVTPPLLLHLFNLSLYPANFPRKLTHLIVHFLFQVWQFYSDYVLFIFNILDLFIYCDISLSMPFFHSQLSEHISCWNTQLRCISDTALSASDWMFSTMWTRLWTCPSIFSFNAFRFPSKFLTSDSSFCSRLSVIYQINCFNAVISLLFLSISLINNTVLHCCPAYCLLYSFQQTGWD
jgi:hypothetical protein